MIKLCTESVQMLCTALRVWGAQRGVNGEPIYFASHINHPCNLWVRKSGGNWCWLYWHAKSLSEEYARRFNRPDGHSAFVKAKEWDLAKLFYHYAPQEVWIASPTPFVNCASNQALGLDFRHEADVHKAYRRYLGARWRRDVRPALCSVHYLYESSPKKRIKAKQ